MTTSLFLPAPISVSPINASGKQGGITAAELQRAINAAELAGSKCSARALLRIYQRKFGRPSGATEVNPSSVVASPALEGVSP